MNLGLGLGLPVRRGRRGASQVSNDPFLPGEINDLPGEFIEPPIVVSVDDGIQFKGKKASGASGKFIYDIGVAAAGITYTMRYDPDWSLLTNQGVTAMVGFGLRSGNDFHLAGLKGNGSSGVNAYEIFGTDKWNKTSGFSEVGGGAALGTKDGPNWVRFEVSADATTYTLSTSNDGVTWVEELTAVTPSPFSLLTSPPVFGIAVFLEAADAGSFTVDITLWQTSATAVEENQWTPDALPSLTLWLKGDTLSGADGSNVSLWSDASGNGVDATASVNFPTLQTAELNSLNVVLSTNPPASRMFFPDGATWIDGSPSATVMFVVKCNGSNGPVMSANPGGWNDHYPHTDNNIYDGFAATARKTVGDPGDMTQWHIGCMRSATNDWKYFFNATEFFSTGTNTVGFGGETLFSNEGGDCFNGLCAEVVLFVEALSVDNRQKVEGYLAWKWGIESVLPVGHPYKDAAPTA
jgi:hypothetical protein